MSGSSVEGLNQIMRANEEFRKQESVIQNLIKSFLRHESLYKSVPIQLVFSLEALYPQTVLLYCTTCKAERPFHDSIPIEQKIYHTDARKIEMLSGVYSYDYACTGCKTAFYCWVFVDYELNTIEKIGQKPSVADLYSGELVKYRKILKDKYSEFSKAVGLKAHGVGVGSFVYLRRIFEDLVAEAYRVANQDPAWDDDAYQKSRMDKKIILLKNYLPEALVSNAGMYSILSKGIHSLSEDECLKYFNTIKLGIELILDEKIEKEERQNKIKSVTDEISRIKGNLS